MTEIEKYRPKELDFKDFITDEDRFEEFLVQLFIFEEEFWDNASLKIILNTDKIFKWNVPLWNLLDNLRWKIGRLWIPKENWNHVIYLRLPSHKANTVKSNTNSKDFNVFIDLYAIIAYLLQRSNRLLTDSEIELKAHINLNLSVPLDYIIWFEVLTWNNIWIQYLQSVIKSFSQKASKPVIEDSIKGNNWAIKEVVSQ